MLLPHAMGEGRGAPKGLRRKERNVMSKPVYITADSTCDLSAGVVGAVPCEDLLFTLSWERRTT